MEGESFPRPSKIVLMETSIGTQSGSLAMSCHVLIKVDFYTLNSDFLLCFI